MTQLRNRCNIPSHQPLYTPYAEGMYGVFTNIFPIYDPNVGKYSIHGSYGHYHALILYSFNRQLISRCFAVYRQVWQVTGWRPRCLQHPPGTWWGKADSSHPSFLSCLAAEGWRTNMRYHEIFDIVILVIFHGVSVEKSYRISGIMRLLYMIICVIHCRKRKTEIGRFLDVFASNLYFFEVRTD